MLHHASFSVHDPARAAALIADLVCGRAVRAPCPPFPAESWFVIFGDEAGSLIELTPWGSVLDPDQRGISNDADMRPHSASHVLVGTPHASSELISLAAQHGLRAAHANAGLFEFVKVWIEDSMLLELLPPEFAPAYVECFGAAGAASVDAKLRWLEQQIARQVAAA